MGCYPNIYSGATRFTMILFLFAVLMCSGLSAQESTLAIVKVHQRSASELLPAVETALSPGGDVVVDPVGNVLIFRDHPENIEKIKSMLQQLDQAAPIVALHLHFLQTQEDGAESLPLPWLRTTGAKGKVKKIFLRTRSGTAAYICIAREVPFTETWRLRCHRQGYTLRFSGTRRIETGFSIRPIVMDTGIDCSIVPVISFANGERIELVAASSQIQLRPGSWQPLLAVNETASEIVKAIFSTGEISQRRETALLLMAEIE